MSPNVSIEVKWNISDLRAFCCIVVNTEMEQQKKPDFWKCPVCGTFNQDDPELATCWRCQAPRPEGPKGSRSSEVNRRAENYGRLWKPKNLMKSSSRPQGNRWSLRGAGETNG